MQIRDRIKDFRRVRADSLRPHPRNWRTHPAAQQDAVRGVLAEVGYADALVARQLPDGGRIPDPRQPQSWHQTRTRSSSCEGRGHSPAGRPNLGLITKAMTRAKESA